MWATSADTCPALTDAQLDLFVRQSEGTDPEAMHNDRALSPSPSDRGHKSSFIVGLGIFEQNPEVQQCNNISHLDEPCDTAADLFTISEQLCGCALTSWPSPTATFFSEEGEEGALSERKSTLWAPQPFTNPPSSGVTNPPSSGDPGRCSK